MDPRSRFFRARRPLPGAVALAVAAVATLAVGSANADPLVFDGPVPDGGPDHFFLDFEVPAGTQEIEIRHDDKSDANILDWGLYDQDGYRGWGGGTGEATIVGELASSRAYVPGPIKPGTWRVVVGKAKVVASPAVYHVEIDFRTAPTLPPAVGLRPYVHAPARKVATKYWAGDFHTHSRESTDAKPTITDMIALAKVHGLDFIEVSDHNTVTQLDMLGAIQDNEPDFLLVPGIEYTTYKGHANAIGATKWVDHKIGQPGVTIDVAADQIAAQGAILSVNHPSLDIGDLCIGCAWKHDLDGSKIHGVEIETGGLRETGGIFTPLAIAFWDALLDQGFKIPAIGGSDDHTLGVANGPGAASPIGNPTTLVRATELSVPALLDGIKRGATVVKLQGLEDPMAELEAAPAKTGDAIAFPGDTIGVRRIFLRVTVTGGNGQQLRLVKNGVPLDPVAITADPFHYASLVDAPAQGEERWRAEVIVDDRLHVVTSHIWLKNDPAGPSASDDDSGGGGGCSTTSAPASALPVVLVVSALASLAAARSRRRRP